MDFILAAFIRIMISATTLLNLYGELSECCAKRKPTVWVNVGEFTYLYPIGTARLYEVSVY